MRKLLVLFALFTSANIAQAQSIPLPPYILADSIVCATGASGAADSVLIPAKVGLRPYVTWVYVSAADSTTAVAAGAPDTLTSTNMPGGFTFLLGNAITAGGTNQPLAGGLLATRPFVGLNLNTVTKFRVSPPGAHAFWTVCAQYYMQP